MSAHADEATNTEEETGAKPRGRSALATRLLIGTPLLLVVLGVFAGDYALERAGADPFGLAVPVMWGFLVLVALVVLAASFELGTLMRKLGWPVPRGLCAIVALGLVGLASFVSLYIGHTEVERTRAYIETTRYEVTEQPDTPGAIGRADAQAELLLVEPAQLGIWTWQRVERVAPRVLLPAWFAAILLLWVVAFWGGRELDARERLTSALGASFLVTLLGGAFACAVLLRGLAEVGFALALLALLSSRMGDAGAYFAGRLLGRHKLVPKVSPKKTIEGALGGLVVSGLLAWLIGTLFPALLVLLPLPWLIVTGVLLGVGAQLADLLASSLKRAAEVKDSSTLIPEFGGVVDLTDSFLFALPMLVAILLAKPYLERLLF